MTQCYEGILCASPEYIRKYRAPQTLGDLPEHQLIAFKNTNPVPLISSSGQHEEFDPSKARNRLIVDDGAALKETTKAGAGISTNALWSVHQELADGALVRVLPEFRLNNRTHLWLVYPQSNVSTEKVRVFIDFLVERIGRSPVWMRVE